MHAMWGESSVLDELCDVELLLRWRQGTRAAGELLFQRHYRTIWRYFRNKVPPGSVRDLVQDTFLACVTSCERFAQRSTFRTYLLGIAHHVMVDYLRAAPRRASQGLADAPVDIGELILDEISPTADDVIATRRERRLLLRALRRLRFAVQVVLELRYWESMTDVEIAEVLGEPLGTVKTRLRTGLIALEAQLTELASSPDVLRSTLDSLHRWAHRVRLAAPPGEAPPRDNPQLR
jgi:RNA polymerase sigma factor (sigma-70 family)